MSAHDAPVVSRQNIPFKTRRSSIRALPHTLVGRSGSITDHSKSVKKRAFTASMSMETVNHKPFNPKIILWVCDLDQLLLAVHILAVRETGCSDVKENSSCIFVDWDGQNAEHPKGLVAISTLQISLRKARIDKDFPTLAQIQAYLHAALKPVFNGNRNQRNKAGFGFRELEFFPKSRIRRFSNKGETVLSNADSHNASERNQILPRWRRAAIFKQLGPGLTGAADDDPRGIVEILSSTSRPQQVSFIVWRGYEPPIL